MVDREQLKQKYGDEEVLVVKYTDLPKLNEGLNNEKEVIQQGLEMLKKSYFIPRWASDFNPDEVEIIPYPVIRTTNTNKVFCTKRIGGSNEKRLVDKLSIGIGGHVNPEGDLKGYYLIFASMKRELMEELDFDPQIMLSSHVQFKGLIRCYKTEVDLDHVGFLYHIIVPDSYEDLIRVRETGVLEGGFVPIESLYEPENYEKLENWSKIALPTLTLVK